MFKMSLHSLSRGTGW